MIPDLHGIIFKGPKLLLVKLFRAVSVNGVASYLFTQIRLLTPFSSLPSPLALGIPCVMPPSSGAFSRSGLESSFSMRLVLQGMFIKGGCLTGDTSKVRALADRYLAF